MRKIPLLDRRGQVRAEAVVDDDDYAWASAFRWHLLPTGYVVRNHSIATGNSSASLHRELLGLVKGDGLFADHINGDKLDNRRENLRILTPGQSASNVAGDHDAIYSQHRGVDFHRPSRRWRARVRDKHVGYFATEDEAAVAARDARATMMPFSVER